jgi:hypothetical protein
MEDCGDILEVLEGFGRDRGGSVGAREMSRREWGERVLVLRLGRYGGSGMDPKEGRVTGERNIPDSSPFLKTN